MTHVLLTGAGGFIGSHLAEAILNQGYHLRALVHYNSRGDPGLLRQVDPHLLSDIELVSGDLTDPDAVRRAVQGCDLVYHLGALISIPYSYRNPAHAAQVNIIGTLNVLLACRDAGVSRLVHTSTSEVYGTARRVPITEDHPLQAQSPYSATKIAADKLVESFHLTYDLPAVTVRPFNTFGPRQSARAVIPTIITQALTRPEVLLGSLDPRRDFTFVSDTVSGFLKAGETPGIEGQVFNLGTGVDFTIGDLAGQVLAIAPEFSADKTPRTLALDPARLRPVNSEVMRLISDHSRATAAMGWTPQVALADGLRQTDVGAQLVLDPVTVHNILEGTRSQVERMAAMGHHPVALCSPRVRIHFKRLAERMIPSLAVLSYNELSSSAKLETVGMVTANESAQDTIPQYA